ncbi:unnamed protein product [Caenorhabditis sp. 36 PRJEB53466]|nr:unnamed protein product [Caenorhabditis sp. 36 PRJEB53466]
MNLTIFVGLIVFFCVQVCFSLTMEGLFRKIKTPEDVHADPVGPEPSFVRPISTVAGRPVIPRRWTYEKKSDPSSFENLAPNPIHSQHRLMNINRLRGRLN